MIILPIGDDQVKGGSFPIFSYVFIAINILVFILLQLPSDEFTMAYSVIPMEITSGQDFVKSMTVMLDGQAITQQHQPGPVPIYLTLISNIFMHGGWMHLIGNMIFLWVFADNIESTVGSPRFVLFYVLGGVIASLAHIASDPASITPSLGASGAIAACLGAYLVMFPKSKVKVLVFITIISVPAFLFLGFWIVQQYLGVIGSGEGVAWWAHIGGLVFGVIVGFYFKEMYPKVIKDEEDFMPIRRPSRRYNNREITRSKFFK